jgi:16S rRNA (cytidine1402-2'-O)-methyltransferase
MTAPGERGELWVVGTPIGNLEDLSPRAVRALSEADAIFCEDTRVTAKLAARYGLRAPPDSPCA